MFVWEREEAVDVQHKYRINRRQLRSGPWSHCGTPTPTPTRRARQMGRHVRGNHF